MKSKYSDKLDVKLNHIFIIILSVLFISGCGPQPVAQSLLTSGNSTTIVAQTPAVDEGQLDIQPDNASMSVNIDNSDRVEITGNCKDLDRKKNRIIVEVFAGEDETVTPYISNSLSDKCQTTAAGLSTNSKCFWVTKGIGLVEDQGLPTERNFPQCHNGRFGFSIKLGKMLETATPGIYSKYTVRFKLRTLDGILSDTAWNKVLVDRNMNNPVINSVIVDQIGYSCLLKMSPARFNFGITYNIKRTVTDITGTSAPVVLNDLGPLTTDILLYPDTTSDSAFNWKDDRNVNSHASSSGSYGALAGVTYNYTLEATENNFTYTVPQTRVSNSVSCTLFPLSVYLASAPVNFTCDMAILGNYPNNLQRADIQWARSTQQGWTGPNSDNNNPAQFTTAGCAADPGVGCKEVGFPNNGATYYYAVREIRPAPNGQIGKWSPTAACKPAP